MVNRYRIQGTARSQRGSWARRMMQGAVVAVIAASVPGAWGAGGIPTAGLSGGGIQVTGVSAGTAAFSQIGSITTVRTGSQNTIINYSQLTVSFGDTLQFVQPTDKSRVLNRINSASPTQINGTVLSNGYVYFVNPAGVMFGNGAVINVGGMYAAAGHIADTDFLAANNLFTDNTGMVRNNGVIQGNEVHLIGQNVVNAGTIVTSGLSGIVTLTAGKDVYIGQTTSPSGGGTVLVKVSGDTTTVQQSTGVTNAGTIDAGKGQLHMGAGDLYAAGIYNSGSVKAQSITLDSGKNTNITTGKIDASNSNGVGGAVQLLGDRVGVDGGTVDASGTNGGGVIHVGGDLHGGGTTPTSNMTYVDRSAVLKADALVSGNGGQVVVWANEATRYFGSISAAGGALGGNGGYVEVSGKNDLVFSGAVNTLAPHGTAGTLLLDPSQIDVNTAGTAGFGNLNQVNQFSDPDSGNNRIDPSTIDAAGTNVVLQATGTITVTSAISMTNGGVGITMQSGGNIAINANITTKGGAITLSAGDQGTSGAGSTVNGAITIGNNTLDTTGGAATGADITLRGHDVTIDPAATLNAGTGTVFFYTNVASEAINIGGVGGYNISTAELDTAIQTAANIEIGEQSVQSGAITWDVGSPYTYNPNGTVGLRLNTSGNLTLNGALSPQSVNDHLNLTLSGTVSITADIDLGGGEFFANGGGFTTTGAINTISNSINIMPTGPVSIQALVDASSLGTVRLGGTTITEAGSGEVLAGSLAVRATDDVTLDVTTEVGTLGAVNTGSGKKIDIQVAEGVNFNTVSAATVPTGFAAFAAVSGIQTNNGNITVSSDGNMVISNPVGAGTANVNLSTAAASTGNINGSGTNVVSGANITLNADGGIGTTTAPILAPTGNVSLTTAGANAAGKINVAFFTSGAPGTLTTSQVTTLATDAATAQDITFHVAGDVTVNGALSIGTDTSLSITASGNINGDGNAAHALSGPTINLSAAGIGIANPVSVNPTVGAALTTTGTGSAGNITLTTTAALNDLSFDTDNASAQVVTVENSGALNVTANVGAEAGDTLVLHAGTSGVGNLSFTGSPTIKADTIVLWAGIGDGSASTAIVDFTNHPVLTDHTGVIQPSSVTVRQDGTITDAVLTTGDFANSTLPNIYNLESDGGNVTVATAANVAGTNLTLAATKSGQVVNINANLTGGNALISLTANGTTINGGGNVTSSGNQTYNGAFQLAQDSTLTGFNIVFTSTVTSQAGQFLGLTTVGSGMVWFQANVGSSGNELGSLVSNGVGTTQLGNGSAFTILTKEGGTADGHVTLSNTALFGDTTISATTTTAVASLTAGVADVTFTGTLVSQAGGDFALTVNSPGVTWFQGNVGGSVGGSAVLGGIHTDFEGGAFEKTQLGNGGTVSVVVGSPITFDDAVVLKADTTLSASDPGGVVTFNKTVDSDASGLWTLSVAADSSIIFKGNVGSAVNGELGAVSTTGTGSLVFGNGGAFSITTKEDTTDKASATGAQSYDNATTLMGDTTLVAKNTTALASLGAGQDDITLGGSLFSQSTQFFGITVNTPGVTWFKGGVSGVAGQELGSITTDLQGGALEETKFGTSGSITVLTKKGGTATGAQIYNDNVVLTGNTIFRGQSLAFNGSPTSLNASTFDLALASDSMTFAGGANSVTGTGNLTIEPLLDTDAIVIGTAGAAANTLFVSRTAILTFKDGFASITIGSPTGSHVITVESDSGSPFTPVTFLDPVTIQSPNGSITVNKPTGAPEPQEVAGIYGDGNASITLKANAITLNASIMTNGNDITINGPTILGNTSYVLLKSFGGTATDLFSAGNVGGNVTVIGTVDDDATPTLFDIVANGVVTSGNVDLQGAIGGITPVNGVAVAGGDLKIHANIQTTGPGGFDGIVSLSTATITMAGNANPATPTTITIDTDASGGTADAGNFISAAAINHQAGTGAVSLVIDTSAGTGHLGANITLGSVGASQVLSGLSLIAGTAAVSVADVTLTGAFSSSGAAFGNSGAITTGGNAVTINQTGLVTISAAIDAGAGDVGITGVGITTTAAGTLAGNAITLAGGSGNVTLGATVTGTGLFSSGGAGFSNAGLISADGITINQTGAVAINAGLNSAGFAVNVTGVGITSAAGGAISGAAVTLHGGTAAVNLTGAVTATGALGITGTGITTNAGATLGGAAITLTGGTGNVTLGAAVTGAGLFTSGGAGFSNAGLISADGITINQTGSVAINAGLSSAGFAVNVTGVGITSAAGGAISGSAVTLDGGTSPVNLTGAVTATGALGITGTGITTNAGGTLGGAAITLTGGTGNVTLGDTVTGTGLFTSGGAGFSNAALISADGITINQTGSVAINAGLSSAGFAVNVTGVGITSAAGGAISGSAVTLDGGTSPVNLTGAVTATGALGITGTGITTNAGATLGGAAITLTGGTGNVGLGDVVTGTGLLTVSGVNFTNTAAVTGVGATMTMTGPVSIQAAFSGGSGAVAITGTTFNNTAAVSGNSIKLSESGAITLAGNLNANSGAGAITISTSSGGLTQTAGVVNGASLALSGTGAFSLPMANTISTTLAANITGALSFTNASGIGVGTAGSPAVTGISATTVTLNITGTTTVSQNITATTGDILINSPVTIAAGSPTVSANGNLTTGALSVVSGTPLLSAGGNLLAGAVTVSAGTPGLSANGNLTTGAITGSGNLSLRSGGSVATNTTSVISIGAVGTSEASRFGNITFLSANLVQLGGDIFANNVSFQDNLAGTRADVPVVATVERDTATSATHTLTIDTNGTFTMEQDQKLTVFDSSGAAAPIGNLTIKTNHQTLTVGDLSALGKITLDTGDVNTHIVLINRAPAHEKLPSGSADPSPDLGADIVAGFNGAGAISMKGTVTVVGADTNHRIQFASVDASQDIQSVAGVLNYIAGANLAVIPVNIATPITETKLLSGTTVLDLVAVGTSGQSPSSIQGTVIPRDVQTLQPEQGQEISGALRDALRELGIYARDLQPDEVIEFLSGRALYDDVPYKLDPLPTDNQVASNRLPYSPVLPTVDAYRALFFKPELDANGNPVMENGKPKMIPQDQAILTLFGQTWQQYRTDKGDAATPEGFRGYLEANEKSDPKFPPALSNLNQLRDLLGMIKGLGLTDTEFDVSRKVLLSKVRPANIREEDFLAVVNGPSTRTNGATAVR